MQSRYREICSKTLELDLKINVVGMYCSKRISFIISFFPLRASQKYVREPRCRVDLVCYNRRLKRYTDNAVDRDYIRNQWGEKAVVE
jgi:hypothetical protein